MKNRLENVVLMSNAKNKIGLRYEQRCTFLKSNEQVRRKTRTTELIKRKYKFLGRIIRKGLDNLTCHINSERSRDIY